SPMTASIPGRCRPIWATATSSTQCATPSWRRPASRTSGTTDWPARLVLMMSIITGMDTSSPLDRPSVGARAPALRARVTNHKDLLPGLDGRSATARRFRDLVNAFVADMGGLDHCSEIKLGLLRRLAATTVQAELLEARMVNGEAIDIATRCTGAPPPVRLTQRLGLGGRAPKVTPWWGHSLAARKAPATDDTPSMDAEGTE